MNNGTSFDQQVGHFGFWSVIAVIVTSVVSMLLPLDIPDGYVAEHADRVIWLNENRGVFIAGWVNQIAAMFSLSAAFACAAWVAAKRNALLGSLGAFFVAMATMAFIIPKFIAIWTIPILADTITSGSAGAEMADSLLLLLNVTIPFSLYTSFDYLGFWLYSVFALLVAASLYGETSSAKVASISLGLFGLIYQALLLVLLSGVIAPVDIGTYFISAAMLSAIHVVAMGFVFKRSMSATS